MIEVSDLIQMVRMKAHDIDEAKYSNYDIIDALDDVVDYINKQYSLRNADFLEKKKTYSENESEGADFWNDGVRLPYDFVSIVGVYRLRDHYMMSPAATPEEMRRGQFVVIGEKLYTREHDFTLVYRRKLEQVESPKDVILLPELFKKTLANATYLAVTGNETTFQEAVDGAVSDIVAARKYVHVKRRMPFYV